jgi:DNA adenine methylase
MPHIQLCHYPGCKAQVRGAVIPPLLSLCADAEVFVDAFAGAGGIALEMIYQRPDLPVIANDSNASMIALWRSVREHPGELIERVWSFTPTLGSFYEFRSYLRDVDRVPADPRELVMLGFRRLVHQRTAHSGFPNGGPRGGNSQRRHLITEKWNPRHIAAMIQVCSARLAYAKSLMIRHGEFEEVIADRSRRAVVFCDPPYLLIKANDYYVSEEFRDTDHARLRDMLVHTPHNWLATIGDKPFIRVLYRDCTIREIAAAGHETSTPYHLLISA